MGHRETGGLSTVSLFGFILAIVLASIGLTPLKDPGYGQSAEPDGSEDVRLSTTEFDTGEIRIIRETADDLKPLNTLIVSQDGTEVIEYAVRGHSIDRPQNIKSASKSVLSALVGIAIKEGHLTGLEQTVGEFFPTILEGEPDLKRSITLRNLLLMRSGLESTSFGNYGAWVTSENWLKDALERPLLDRPGTVTNYSTGNSHIVAAVLTEATGRDLKDYAQERIFDPLGVRIHAWQRSPEGYRFGGNNLSLTPQGMLRFGQLYLNDGHWNDEQVLPDKWVHESTQSYVHDTYHGYPYGYFWWNVTYQGLDVDFAWGHGGQFVFVVPELDLVVVTTSDLQNKSGGTDGYTEKIHRLLKTEIMPAAMEETPDKPSGSLIPW